MISIQSSVTTETHFASVYHTHYQAEHSVYHKHEISTFHHHHDCLELIFKYINIRYVNSYNIIKSRLDTDN